jgi:putative ABC transport system ATP-binding protein
MYTLENVLIRRRLGAAGFSLRIARLHLARGEQIALTGLSGSGKSTALDILGMVLQPDEAGHFIFTPAGKPIDAGLLWRKKNLDRMADVRLKYMGYVLQTGGLLPYLTVADNMGLTARMQGLGLAEIQKRVRALAEELGISQLLSSLPASLSVGERQRAAIGRALASNPKLVLADEPTAALDPIHANKVMEMFRMAVGKMGATLVMVSHDLTLVHKAGLREVKLEITTSGDGAVLATIDDSGSAPCRAA